jgi:hypothetical protein
MMDAIEDVGTGLAYITASAAHININTKPVLNKMSQMPREVSVQGCGRSNNM